MTSNLFRSRRAALVATAPPDRVAVVARTSTTTWAVPQRTAAA